MYTVEQILASAKIASKPFTKNGITVRLTAGNQLVDTYKQLLKFRAANITDYPKWEAHHILEELDISRLGIDLFAPPSGEQICVLLPKKAHERINSTLRHRNETDLTVAVSYLRGDYREVYNDVENYCGSSKDVIAQELNKVFEAVLVNMVTIQDKALAGVQSDLQRLLNLIALEKGLHDRLIRGSSPSVAQTGGTILSLINPLTTAMALVNPANRQVIGAFVNLFNPNARPNLSIWTKTETYAVSAIQALRRRDLSLAFAALALSQVHFQKADLAFNNWRKNIDLAGRRAQIAIGVTAAVAVLAATGVFLAEAAGGAATASAASGATASGASTAVEGAGQGAKVRVAVDIKEVTDGARKILTATSEAVELEGEGEGEGEIVDGTEKVLKRAFLPSF